MNIRKLIIISPLGLLLLVGLVMTWFLADDAWIKGKIEETVSEKTGRSFLIDGPFSLDWSANPVLTAEDVHFSNPSWAENPDLAKLGKLEVSVDLFSVFEDQFRINYITVNGLVIALEERDSGEKSWDMFPAQEEQVATSKEPSKELPISIGSISLADFSLLHEAPDRNVPLDFHLAKLALSENPEKQIHFTTDGRFGGEQFDLVGNLGPLNELVAGGEISHDIKLTLGEIMLQSQGSIEQLSSLSGANIKLAFTGPEFEWILTQLALPQFSHGDFDFNLDLHTAGDKTRLDLVGDLGSLQANAKGEFTGLAATGTANLVAEVSGDDLGSLLELAGVADIPPKPFRLNVDVSHVPGLYALQSLELEAGDNRMSISGQLGDWPEIKDTRLQFSLDGADLSTWSPILKMDDLPTSAFALAGEVSSIAAGFELDAVSLELGDSHFVASGTVGKPPGFTDTQLNVEAAGPSLANYRFLPGLQEAPDLPFRINGDVGLQDSGLTFGGLKLKFGDNDLQLNGVLGLNDQFEGTNLQTRINLPNLASLGPLLGVEGLPGEHLDVNGSFQRIPDGWAFQLTEGKFAAATFESDGKYTDSDGRRLVEATSHLIAPNLAQLALIAGVDNIPELPVDIKGFARYDKGQIEVRDIEGSLGDSQFKMAAKIENAPTWSGSEIKLTASGQDIGQFLVVREFEHTLPFSFDGSIALEERNIRLSQVKAGLGLLQVGANGIIGNLENPSVTDLQLSVSAASLQNIGEFLDFQLPNEPFHLSTRLQGSPSVFRAENLDIKLGPSDLSGDLSVDLSGKTNVNAMFNSNYLDLAWLQTAINERNAAKDGSIAGEPKETSKQEFLIPDTPISLSQLDIADGDIEFRATKIDLLHWYTTDVHVRARVENGNLYLNPLQTRGMDGGLLSGTLAVEREAGSDLTNLVLSIAGEGVQLGIGTFEGQDPDTFRDADVIVNLNGAGATVRDLARSLNGHIEVVQGPGLTENSGLGLIFGNFIQELLSMVNPFSKTEKYTVNECAVAVINIESGLVTVEPVVSQSEKMTIVAKGVVDLNTEKMQFTFNTKLRKGIGVSASMVVNPFVSVTGTLLSPSIGLDPEAVIVKGTVAVATLGISLLAKSLSDRFLSSKDPCGDALEQSRKQQESSGKKGKNK